MRNDRRKALVTFRSRFEILNPLFFHFVHLRVFYSVYMNIYTCINVTRILTRALHVYTRGKLHSRRIIFTGLFLFSRKPPRRYRFDKPSFRKRVRCSDVFGMVRSTPGHADGRERERNGGRMYAYNMYGDLYDRMHTKIRYTEGLGSVSPLLFA